jgi:hypothetical protein
MGHFLFFLFAVVAGLFWTAACTAAAARVERGWLKALLAALGAGDGPWLCDCGPDCALLLGSASGARLPRGDGTRC